MNVTAQHAVIHLERIIPAPPERVYRAWLDPELVARWMNPGSMVVSRVEVDERVGGHYRIWHADGSGSELGGFDCELTELVPGERIAFRWGFVGPERRDGPVFDSLMTITLSEAPGGATHLTLVHERLDDLAAAMPQVAEKIGVGWDDTLSKLFGLLARAAAGPAEEAARARPAQAEADIADLSLPEAGELLRHGALARLAYNGLDGLPRVVPVGFLWRDGRIIVCTAPTAPKVRALAARPQVALTIDTVEGTASKAVLVRGVATMEIVDGVPEEYLEAGADTMPAEERAQFEASVRATYQQMARISIEPRWARFFDFGAGRLPEFLRELVASR
jgi:uncharacterized protein YndB with AHSA1/START domain